MSEDKDKKAVDKKYTAVVKQHVHSSDCNHEHEEANKDEHCFYKGGPMSHELFSHLPFSVLSVTLGIIAAGLICFLTPESILVSAGEVINQSHDHSHDHAGHDHAAHEGHDHGEHEGHDHAEPEEQGTSPIGFLLLFHLFHPAHILFSAIATTAMFYKYDKNLFKAIIIGCLGSILICTVSDALIPTITAKIMGYSAPIHLCILESPMQVIPFAIIGVLLGLAAVISGSTNSTISSHSIHVITSTMATLFYTIAYTGQLVWVNQIGTVFLMTVVAVGGICCLSDVIFPLMFTKEARKQYAIHGHDHPH